LWMVIDPFLIGFYRLTGYAFVDFLVGTFVLACIALVVGEVTIGAAFLAVKPRIDASTNEARRYQDLSGEALSSGDKEAYHAANKLANDAFGKSFFMQIALSAAFMWPVFIALAWMGKRFADLEFPLLFTDVSLGFIGVFMVLYAAAYLMFKRVKYRLPYFRKIKAILDTYGQTAADRGSRSAVHPLPQESVRG
jgi:hypothetical protein